MQLFSLINTLLNHEADAFSRNLHLLPYEVIPAIAFGRYDQLGGEYPAVRLMSRPPN